MTESTAKPRRVVSVRRTIALGTAAAAALAAGTQAGLADERAADPAGGMVLAAGEGGEGEGETSVRAGGESGSPARGEGEGEGATAGLPTEVAFLSDLGFMTGHLRAGMALYEQDVLEEAKTHMGHPIEEKYDAVAEALEARGFGGLRAQILALSAAAEAEAPVAEVRPRFDQVIATVDEVRAGSPGGARDQLLALAALTRIAAEEYDVAIADDGSVGNLHEYQDSWGFLRTVEVEAGEFAESDDPAVAAAGNAILEQVRATDAAYGDLAGAGIPSPDPSILFGAAARMELAAMELS